MIDPPSLPARCPDCGGPTLRDDGFVYCAAVLFGLETRVCRWGWLPLLAREVVIAGRRHFECRLVRADGSRCTRTLAEGGHGDGLWITCGRCPEKTRSIIANVPWNLRPTGK